uniref:Serine proteinase-like protein G n=1 Tax=Penaeus indicus TaxID=29960 RepID=E7D083_PENIN|nr:serine proteinase-like protein G [Penaeus indicus]
MSGSASLWLGTVLLFVYVEGGVGPYCVSLGGSDGSCGNLDECSSTSSYLRLVRKKNDPSKRLDSSVQPFFNTALGEQLLNYVSRCCESATPNPNPLIPTEESTASECGFSEPIGPANDLQRRGAWPWFAAGSHSGTRFLPVCGGSLTRRHVLTGAHCMCSDKGGTSTLYVRLGDYDLSRDDEANHVDFAILNHANPGYNRINHRDDISILTLERDVEFNDYMRPVCLPFNYQSEDFLNKRLAVVGYGRTDTDSDGSKLPVYAVATAVLSTVDLATCQTKYNQLNSKVTLADSQMCAVMDGGENGDSCGGDGGGPLNYFDISTRRAYVVGTVSLGVGCGNTQFPGVYTRVGAYIRWLKNKIDSGSFICR